MERILVSLGLVGLMTVSLAATAAAPPQPASNALPQPASRSNNGAHPPPVPRSLQPQPQSVMPHPATRNRPLQPGYPRTYTPHPGSQLLQRNQPAQINKNNRSATAALPKNQAPTMHSVTVEQVLVPGNLTYHGYQLALNGAGIHTTWFIFNQFVAALYLAQPTHIGAAAITRPGAKAIVITLLQDKSRDDFVNMLKTGFDNNTPDKEQNALQNKWQQFAAAFTDLKQHDKVMIAYIPNQGTSVTINDKPHGQPVPGAPFSRAIFASWLGEEPIDTGLKSRLLGTASL